MAWFKRGRRGLQTMIKRPSPQRRVCETSMLRLSGEGLSRSTSGRAAMLTNQNERYIVGKVTVDFCSVVIYFTNGPDTQTVRRRRISVILYGIVIWGRNCFFLMASSMLRPSDDRDQGYSQGGGDCSGLSILSLTEVQVERA